MTDEDQIRRMETAALLIAAAREARMVITGDFRVGEKDAAALLGLHPDTLRKKRDAGTGPPSYRGFNGARFSYRFTELAEWIETSRDS
jgi:hypothetical protein